MKTIQFLLFFLTLSFNVFAQNTDLLSYHTSHQISDSSYSLKKANGDSTIFLFEGGNSGSNYRTMSENADSTQLIWQGGNQPSDTLEIWGAGVTTDSSTTGNTGSTGGNYLLPYNSDSTDYLGGDTTYHALPFRSLTTTGVNTNATLVNGVLNIPNYANSSWNFGGNNTGPTTFQTLGSTNYTPVLLSWNVQSGFLGGGNSAAYGYDSYKLDTAMLYGFSDNAAFGMYALRSLNRASAHINTGNLAAGYNALGNATVGYNNTALGSFAMVGPSISSNNTYRSNVAIGPNSLFSLTNGIGNIAIGDSSLRNMTLGNYNIAIGHKPLWNKTTLYNTLYIGDSTYHMNFKLDSAVGTAPNVIGKDGNGYWHVYQAPVAGGGGITQQQLEDTANAIRSDFVSGGNNYVLPIASSTILGGIKVGNNLTIDSSGALIAAASWNLNGNNTANSLSFLGPTGNYPLIFKSFNQKNSGFTGGGNSASFGYYTYSYDTAVLYSYSMNTAFGVSTLHSLNRSSFTTNYGNTAVGTNALGGATTGSDNTAIGPFSLSAVNVSGNNTFKSNVAIGPNALASLTNGVSNLSIGDSSFRNMQTGNYNIGLGYKVAWNQSSLTALTGYPNNNLIISDSTYHIRFKLDSAIGTAPNVIGKDGNGNWHVYQRPTSGTVGTATLISGTVTVSTTLVKTGAKIFVSVNTPSGTQGFLSAPTSGIVNGTSFVINSTSGTENSTVNWQITNL